MKTTIEMPDELFRKVKAVAALRGQTMKELITQLLNREIGAPETVAGGNPKKAADKFSRELTALATQVSRSWKTNRDSVAAVREQRRG